MSAEDCRFCIARTVVLLCTRSEFKKASFAGRQKTLFFAARSALVGMPADTDHHENEQHRIEAVFRERDDRVVRAQGTYRLEHDHRILLKICKYKQVEEPEHRERRGGEAGNAR